MIVALVMVTIAGCAQKKVDLEAERTALRTADTEWSAATTNVESFVAFIAPDGAIYPPNEPAVTGTDNVRAWATRMFAMPGFSVSWQPSTADVAASGDVGYTAGTYTLRAQGPNGEPVNDNGKYLTVWKKDTGGAWRVAHDMFNSDLPPMTAPAPMDTTATPAQ